MEEILQDARYAWRSWRSTPGFAIAAILCLALGIGATTAIFSVVNTVLVRPLPYKEPDKLARLYTEFPTFPNGGLPRFWVSGPEFLDLRRDAKSWETLDAWVPSITNLAGATQPIRVRTAVVTGTLLPTLGIAPELGRVFTPADDQPGAPLTAVLSYGLWKSAFGGDPNIIGHETLANGQKATIIGVMPKTFAFPPGETDPAQMWRPLQLDPAKPGNRGGHYLNLVGRLRQGVTIDQARGEMASLVNAAGAARTEKTHAFDPKTHPIVMYSLHSEVARNVRPALLMLLGAVGFVLLIACVNVANLLLARAEARRSEVAIRGALGAARARLTRQFATEGLLLSGVGALLGVAIAQLSLQLVKITNAGALPRAEEISLDWRVLLVTIVATVATGLTFALAPVLSLLIGDYSKSLRDTAKSVTGSASAQFFRRVLVVSELALALVLLIGCGLMVRGFWKLQQVNVGVRADHVVTMSVSLPKATYVKDGDVDAFWTRLQQRLDSMPGVEAAGMADGLPPLRPPNMNDTEFEGYVKKEGAPPENIDFYNEVTPEYFKAMGVRLISGRLFTDQDTLGAPDVALVNQTTANMYWPGQDPIGRRIRPGGDTDPWVTVVGVVEDVKNAGLDKSTGTEVYIPYSQKDGSGSRTMNIILRSAGGDPMSLVSNVRGEIQSMDPTLAIADVKSMEDVISEAQSRPRFLTILLTLFSAVAGSIAIIGIYGVISYAVARRTREFGLRIALGAQAGDVVGLVLRQAAYMTVAGIAAGLVIALLFSRLMSHVLYSVKATDSMTYSLVAGVLAVVSLAAGYIPAQRATRINPANTLRDE